MKRLLLLTCALALTACAARAPLPTSSPALVAPLPISLQVNTADGQDWLLVIQAEGSTLRWSLFDPLGVPLARQSLAGGAWHNDGLLPPNGEARELFAALLFALTADDELAHTYDAADWRQQGADSRQLAPHWRIHYQAPLAIELENGKQRYRVSPLERQP
ncbi:hypothetical protein [Phytopseudomonas dryadis]|uniref:Lipoprotein n=1 Tax=Phytopseudomonas dryadis TaxID=2487520 RepID=A0A4Q9R8Q6_9GAMM|nr:MULTISPECIES: hypothetical protein [Pseudomonas]TBU97066.1 hypothetical protein DNK44_02435 [Pseudomonas dryadis]TBV08596.1 hypothetical protein DNK34_04850 [Pseudomonas dryadis]TBV18964.1 hypothetical protein DNK41_06275 [Pseudomonas sp. FRB 230]